MTFVYGQNTQLFKFGPKIRLKFKKGLKNYEKILTEKKKFQKIQKDEPSVSEQMKREIHSQSEKSKEKGEFKFKE